MTLGTRHLAIPFLPFLRIPVIAVRLAYSQNLRAKNNRLFSLQTLYELINLPNVVRNYQRLSTQLILLDKGLAGITRQFEASNLEVQGSIFLLHSGNKIVTIASNDLDALTTRYWNLKVAQAVAQASASSKKSIIIEDIQQVCAVLFAEKDPDSLKGGLISIPILGSLQAESIAVLQVRSPQANLFSIDDERSILSSSAFRDVYRIVVRIAEHYSLYPVAKANRNNYSEVMKERSTDAGEGSVFDIEPSGRQLEEHYVAQLRSQTPVHPVTHEVGTFSRFVVGGGYMRPIYATPSGAEFGLPDDKVDELLVRAGGKSVIVDDQGFFTTGDATVFTRAPESKEK
ncbi:MAG: hypothetical protein IT320_05835 [Anaerolineae bacterium]|nr:hypothetical protein [Anaerolineae bacterium]